MLRVIVITGLLLAATPGVARAATWHRPLSGRIVGPFSVQPGAPYAAGQRRGITIAAPAGTRVRSVCPGRVAFAGSVGRAGPTISVQCGALRATYQGLMNIGIEEGALIATGAPLARVGPAGRLHLGARVTRGAYLDPATLFVAQRTPWGPAPRPRPRGGGPEPPPNPPPTPRTHLPLAAPNPQPSRQPTRAPADHRPATRPLAAPDHQPARQPTRAPANPPFLAWLGLALLATTIQTGALIRRTRRTSTLTGVRLLLRRQ